MEAADTLLGAVVARVGTADQRADLNPARPAGKSLALFTRARYPMRKACFFSLVIALGSVCPVVAQTASAVSPHASAASTVPTTKLLAIGTRTTVGTDEAVRQQLPEEVRATARLYLAGQIDQWFVKQDQTGVVFILNEVDLEKARAMLEDLPFGRAQLMKFQFIPLGPLAPLQVLLPSAK